MGLDRRTLLAATAAAMAGQGAARAQGAVKPPGELVPALPRTAPGAQLQVIDLWPGDPPGGGEGPDPNGYRFDETARGVITKVERPCLLVIRPDKPNGSAMIVAAGGGYRFIDIGNEGVPVGQMLTAVGVTVFLLIYRLPGEGWDNGPDAPRQDAQRAVRLVRAQSTELGIDPARVGVLGFSAGGHLMGETAVGNQNLYPPVDAHDALPYRPALAGLLYPVITMKAPFDGTSTRRVLVGDEVTEVEMRTYSVDVQVRADTPPMFMAQAMDDPIAVCDHVLLMFAALRKAKIPAEMHLFERGGHGFGLGPPGTPVAAWPGLFLAWLHVRGFLAA
ncbi:hypothetical protein AFCDBAGC_4078 [Methylobacterium cerastii]|uniref:Alpha/beta hydrolase fold-3 domain-containing protein n=1 Tax=Methylobacterium cerastii TaxID=932741 RepID=A0ABQ4QLS2_9HYPH|nr:MULTISPECIES: alpha/beta hydrolase [Methylobacterium]TXM66534.1 alpha/beta hydrolase [Methylobacterium sp. WL120]TXM68247.1 alpha/beta hydrolase [Methylobacterium sp. WL12]TXN82783.1 alpha/beta hydrolase [Methylobacterium sp. WL8]GJD46198.1 hypothetical protein AFCDBAGC_4078 [Methylobacterium cerastii]